VTDIRDPDTAAAYLAQAEEFARHKDTTRMTEALERLAASPDCSAAQRFKAAQLFAAAGVTADAIRYYREAGAAFIDPEADTGRAREAFGEAHALDLQDLEIIFEIARVDRIEGHPRAALAKFTHILHKTKQSHVPALFEAACIYQELGQHDQAVLTLRKVLDRDTTNVQAIINMGQRLQSMGMLPEAVGYFVQAATAAQAAGQLGTCRHVINMVIGLDSNNQQARRILAELEDALAPDVGPEDIAPHVVNRRDPLSSEKALRTAPDVVATPVAAIRTTATGDATFAVDIEEIAARGERLQRKLTLLAAVVAELEETVAALKAEVGDRVQRKLSSITGVVSGFEETIENLKAEVTQLKLNAPARNTKIVDVVPKRAKVPAKKTDDTPKPAVSKATPAKSKPRKSAPAKTPTTRR
jgi:tetratricopeptide (TPR) repeat protein